MNSTHRKTLERLWTEPINGSLEWSRIESLLKAVGCRVIEGSGSAVTFEFQGSKLSVHRPHPGKDALRYRVLAIREFLQKIGVHS